MRIKGGILGRRSSRKLKVDEGRYVGWGSAVEPPLAWVLLCLPGHCWLVDVSSSILILEFVFRSRLTD